MIHASSVARCVRRLVLQVRDIKGRQFCGLWPSARCSPMLPAAVTGYTVTCRAAQASAGLSKSCAPCNQAFHAAGPAVTLGLSVPCCGVLICAVLCRAVLCCAGLSKSLKLHKDRDLAEGPTPEGSRQGDAAGRDDSAQRHHNGASNGSLSERKPGPSYKLTGETGSYRCGDVFTVCFIVVSSLLWSCCCCLCCGSRILNMPSKAL